MAVLKVMLQKNKIKLSVLDIHSYSLGNVTPTHGLAGLVLSTSPAMLVSPPCYRWENQDLEKLNDLIKVIQYPRVRAEC